MTASDRTALVDLPPGVDRAQAQIAVDRWARQLASLDALAGALADAPEPIGAASAAAAARVEQTWRAVDARWGLLSAPAVADLAGSTGGSRRGYAAGLRRARRVLGVPRAGRVLYPGFQFDPQGTPLAVIADLARVFADARWSDAAAILWLSSPSGWLDDADCPALLLRSDPDAVLAAALATVSDPAG